MEPDCTVMWRAGEYNGQLQMLRGLSEARALVDVLSPLGDANTGLRLLKDIVGNMFTGCACESRRVHSTTNTLCRQKHR